MIAGDVMDRAAVLLNDAAKTNFTYAVQIPHLNAAIDELQEEMESNNVPVTDNQSAIIPLAVGQTNIGAGGPALPANLIEIQGLYERTTGTNEDFSIVTRVEFLPPFVEILQSLIYWTWQRQACYFLGATSPRDVRLDYIGSYLIPVVASTDVITLFNAKSFLAYRTAALISSFVGENPTRAEELNKTANLRMDTFLNISTKGKQSQATRRRPFMAAYKVRSGF